MERFVALLSRIILILFTAFFLSLAAACSSEESQEAPEQTEVYMSAASSLQNVLEEINIAFKQEHPNIDVIFNFGSSGTLQQQISQGAPVDLYFSASTDTFNGLIEKNRISENYSSPIIGNELVLIQLKGSVFSFKDIEAVTSDEVGRIAIGTPEIVPAGTFTQQTLESLDLWKVVQNKLVNAQNVRQVLTFVESGNADLGFVYKTDASSSDKVEVITTVDHTLHEPIIYPLGVIKESIDKSEVITVFNYFKGEKAREIFERYGFHPVLDK